VKAAFDTFDPKRDKPDINARITRILDQSIGAWSSLGWPADAIKRPKGGFKYLVPIPPNIPSQVDEFTGLELLDFYITRSCGVKLSSSRSFNPEDDRFIRIIIMQDEETMAEAFRRMHEAGIHFDMTLPEGIVQEYRAFLKANIKKDF
jgi:aspartate/methionine/tyrosine aminotransferase